jgi:hypothetical protein
MADLPNKQAPQNGLIGLLQTIPSIAALFSSPTTTTTSSTDPSTTTESTSISKEGMDALLKQILDSNKGLSSVTSGQRSAGLYNSTSNSLLTNDLLTRAAGEVASRTATKTGVTTGGAKTTAQKTTAPISPAVATGGAGALGLLSALGKSKNAFAAGSEGGLYEAISGRDVVDTFGDYNPATSFSSSSIAGDVGTGYSGYADTFGMSAAPAADFLGGGYGLLDDADSLFLDNAGSFFGDSLSFLGDVGPLPGVGSLLQGDVEGAAEDAAIYFAADAILPGAGTAATLISNVLGGDSVICTEALNQGLMSKELYIKETSEYFPTLSPTLVSGYQFLAAPAVRWMIKSKVAARFFAAGAVAYASHTTGFKKNLLGACIKTVGEPLCTLTGMLLKKGAKYGYA